MLHPHLQLGPVRVDDVSMSPRGTVGRSSARRAAADREPFGQAWTALVLSPASASTRNVVVRRRATPDRSTSRSAFKPPNGVGLEIDGGGFAGGGFLVLDRDEGGILGRPRSHVRGHDLRPRDRHPRRRRCPTAGEGFSLLILIVDRLPADPALVRVHAARRRRAARTQSRGSTSTCSRRRARRHRSAASSFPIDVVANAPRIIADLQRVFPPQRGLFLFGPMAKLGWGTPTLVSSSSA